MDRLCSSLKKNENVVFFVPDLEKGGKTVEKGSVVYVDKEQKKICVCYLEGYKSRSSIIPYEDMLAVYDRDGEMMKFDNISGPSRKLNAE